MEAIFENHFKQDEATLKEAFFRQYYFGKFYAIIDLLMFAVIGINWFYNRNGSFISKLFPVVFMSVFWVYKYYSFRNTVKSVMQRNSECAEGGVMENNIFVTKGGFVYSDNAGTRQRVEFEDLKLVYRTKSCIVLQAKTGVIYICRKDAFTVGTAEGLVAHLKKKGVKVF